MGKLRYSEGAVSKITQQEQEQASDNGRYRKVLQDIRKKDLFSNVLLILQQHLGEAVSIHAQACAKDLLSGNQPERGASSRFGDSR